MLTNDALQQMAQQNFETLEEGHRRLRVDVRALDHRIEALETASATHEIHLTKIDHTPTEAVNLRFSTPVVIGIVVACISVAGGIWSIDSRLGTIQSHQAAQEELARANTKLEDERASVQTKTIDTIGKQLELQRLKLESLTETVLKLPR